MNLYLPESASDEMEDALLGRRSVIVSDLAITELTSAVTRRVWSTKRWFMASTSASVVATTSAVVAPEMPPA